MYQGLSGHSIAFNEHGIAPRDTKLGRRPGAVAEYETNRRFAKRERRRRRALEAAGHYARASRQAPKRERAVLRALRRDVLRAMRNGEQAKFASLASKFETLMALRSVRLQAVGK